MRTMMVRGGCPLVFSMLLLAGCTTASPDLVQRGDVQRLASVEEAVIVSIRPVQIDGSQSGAGSAVGAVIGGVAGSGVGGRREGLVVGVLGAFAGAVAGNAIERAATREDALEILLQFTGGERRAIVQARGSEGMAPGDRVTLVTTGAKTRVTKAPVRQ